MSSPAPARKRAKPIGRESHRAQVGKVESGLAAMLKAIAADPEAGPWKGWAEKMLSSERETPVPGPQK